jgi:hypothetical protein
VNEAHNDWKSSGKILVNQQGRLRYAGNGGGDLSEIRETIKSLIKAKQV